MEAGAVSITFQDTHDTPVRHAVAFSIIATGLNSLRIDINTNRLCRSQFQRGNR